jgi:hypothetical protein
MEMMRCSEESVNGNSEEAVSNEAKLTSTISAVT